MKYKELAENSILDLSRLMEACGLKYAFLDRPHSRHLVTPYGGVWIEMVPQDHYDYRNWSRLMEACGLKCASSRPLRNLFVTPYGGVWIEMYRLVFCLVVCLVTPYGGVWIEINKF